MQKKGFLSLTYAGSSIRNANRFFLDYANEIFQRDFMHRKINIVCSSNSERAVFVWWNIEKKKIVNIFKGKQSEKKKNGKHNQGGNKTA